MYPEEAVMNEKMCAALSRATALLLAFTVTLTSCPVVSTGGEGGTDPVQPVNPVNPPIVKEPPAIPPVFAFFYLDGKELSITDTGRTGFMAANVAGAESLLIVSEDLEPDAPIVYFYGIEGISSAKIQFTRGEDFPGSFVVSEESGTETTATFTGYNKDTASFSVTISDNANTNTETYNDLVLNSGVFTAYTFDEALSDSQNLRIKNIITSLALWTSLAYQTQSDGLAVERNEAGAYLVLAGGAKQVFTAAATVFAVIAVVAVAVVVIACPVVALAAAPFVPGGIAVTGAVAASVGAVFEGIAVASGIAAEGFATAAAAMEDSPSDSPETPGSTAPPYSTGDPGPEGGVLFAVAYEDGYKWFEAAPDDLGPAKMLSGAVATDCEAYSAYTGGKTDWFLPDFTHLNYVYSLYVAGKLDCQPEFYWSSTPHQESGSSTQYYSVIDFNGGISQHISANGSFLARPIRRVSTEELESFYLESSYPDNIIQYDPQLWIPPKDFIPPKLLRCQSPFNRPAASAKLDP